MLEYMDPLTNNFHILDKENEALHLEHAKVVLFKFCKLVCELEEFVLL